MQSGDVNQLIEEIITYEVNLAPQAVKASTSKHRRQLEALYLKLSQN